MLLETILESYPKNLSKTHRKLTLNLQPHHLLFGGKNIGKTDFILQYYQQESFKNLKKLYINLADCRLNPNKDLNDLESFCHKEKIEVLILDSYSQDFLDFPLPNLPYTTLISHLPHAIPNFQTLELPPITFAEYTQIHRQSAQDAFNGYLKYGNLFEGELLNEYKKGELLKSFVGDKTNFWILKNFIQNLGLKASLHQIYTKLKKEGKISKDRFYQYANFLKESKTLFWVEKFEHDLAPKKLYFYDFTLKNAVSYERNFAALFENMVFLELLYGFKEAVFFTDKLDFYLPNPMLGILCMPFIQPHALEQKLSKIIKEREFCERFLILTLNQKAQGENLGTPYTILPFSELTRESLK